MANDVTELLDALHEGSVTLEEVAQRFRERKWPRKHPVEHRTYEDMAARELQDPDPYIPGSYDDVAGAYHQKRISKDQFRVLSEAIADSQRDEDVSSQDR
jgi:hypothetical protein